MLRDSQLVFGRFEWRPAERRLLVDGQPAPLRARAVDVLDTLIQHRDRIVTKNELLGTRLDRSRRRGKQPAGARQCPAQGARRRQHLDDPRPWLSLHARLNGTKPADAPAVPPRPISADAGNLPAELTPLIGREADLPALSGAGAGESPGQHHRAWRRREDAACAGRSATCCRPDWADGAWLVELAAISDRSQLPHALAQALHVDAGDLRTDRPAAARTDGCCSCWTTANTCSRPRPIFVETLLAQTRALHLLVTSQEPLRLVGEQLFRTSPLAVPARDAAADPSLGRCGSSSNAVALPIRDSRSMPATRSDRRSLPSTRRAAAGDRTGGGPDPAAGRAGPRRATG